VTEAARGRAAAALGALAFACEGSPIPEGGSLIPEGGPRIPEGGALIPEGGHPTALPANTGGGPERADTGGSKAWAAAPPRGDTGGGEGGDTGGGEGWAAALRGCLTSDSATSRQLGAWVIAEWAGKRRGEGRGQGEVLL